VKTWWADKGIWPSSYADPVVVLDSGSRARPKIVNFDWELSREEAARVRQTSHFWGSRLHGHFRAFESMMLAALNESLEEPWSVYKLWHSRKAQVGDLQVKGVREGHHVRLRGQTSFATLFTYGLYAYQSLSPRNYWFQAIGVRLGQTLAKKIQSSVEELGWDMVEMDRPEHRRAVNKIFNLPPDYVDKETSIQMMDCGSTRQLEFLGPFHWRRSGSLPCVFEAPEGKRGGIYLWTVEIGAEHRVHYIGQSRRSFRQRIQEHLDSYLNGRYKILDPSFLVRGELRALWDGATAFDDAGRRIECWFDKAELMLPDLRSLLESFRFFLAPFKADARMHQRVEGALGAHYLTHEDEGIREFLDPGSHFNARRRDEDPIRFTFGASAPIAGFPAELPV
jgi:hypothetical protein